MAADPDEHRFDLPEGHRWNDVCKHSTNIGEHLNAAFRAVEDANMRLHNIFQKIDFNDKERFSDADLGHLLQHFSKYDMRNGNVEADVLGNAYEYLIKQFADDSGKKGGEFYTPKEIVRLMVECLEISEGVSVYDPTCGSGGMLLEAYRTVADSGKNPHSLSLYGQERNANTWAICQMNLLLHNIDDADVLKGDTLKEPKHLVSEGSTALRAFDRVIANPPFSLKKWGHPNWKNGDVYGRDIYGCPPPKCGDLAFVQHMLASLNENGKLAVVVPHGVLFREYAEGTIRKAFIENDLIEGVISVAPNLFYGDTTISAAILFLRKQKPKHMRGKVMIVNGAQQYEKGSPKNYLLDKHIKILSETYLAFEGVEQLAAVVSTNDIAANNYSLNITRYVSLGEAAEQTDVAAEIARLRELVAVRDAAEDKMVQHLRRLGYAK